MFVFLGVVGVGGVPLCVLVELEVTMALTG